MRKKRLFLAIFVLLFFVSSNASASESCSSKGFTILTINGIFTNERGARENKDNLKKNLPPTFNNQPLTVNYLYNPTHLAGVGDFVDAVAQGVFEQ